MRIKLVPQQFLALICRVSWKLKIRITDSPHLSNEKLYDIDTHIHISIMNYLVKVYDKHQSTYGTHTQELTIMKRKPNN